jgi:hypothetical protein
MALHEVRKMEILSPAVITKVVRPENCSGGGVGRDVTNVKRERTLKVLTSCPLVGGRETG